MEVKNFITDCKNTEIMVSQIYKDKETLVSVMARHAIANGFNTKTKRSDKKGYDFNWSYLYCVYDSGRRYIVDIECGTCNCGRYQIDEIPCPHRIAALKSKNVDVKDYGRYFSELYRPQTIVKTYELPVVSMPYKKDWNVSCFVDDEEVLPPKYRRPPGRSKKGRHLKSSESLSSNSNRCGKCGRAGHNPRTCGFFPKES
ncbi:uncharacterized protein LOC124886676 [Capsicum annuum]|uniref:uncharacterized protein LOC124886676 n=1 Tax=Capsicum annuum TaxID=4072 RepID=UPI001FB0DB9F|nr:uncharacterized protein LOC124886676 [Capsicum annuum]